MSKERSEPASGHVAGELSVPSLTPIGFVGLGLMGAALTTNLRAAGCRVRGYDINPDRVRDFVAAGGTAATSPADAATEADIVMTSLMSSDIVRAVMMGEHGALETMRPDVCGDRFKYRASVCFHHPGARITRARYLDARRSSKR